MKTTIVKKVIMGGSFNPPTLAYYRLMKLAIYRMGRDQVRHYGINSFS